MDDLPHLAQKFRDRLDSMERRDDVLEERVNRLEKRMSKVEKIGKHAEMPNGRAAAKRIDRRDRETV